MSDEERPIREENNGHAPEGEETHSRKSWRQRHKGWLIVILILVLAGLALFIWKEIEVNRYAKDLDRQQTYYQEELNSHLNQEREHYLKLVMKPLVWAIRTEMLDEDYSQINQYLTNFVRQEENAQLLLVIDEEGTIRSATDKKMEGSEFSKHYEPSYLEANDVQVSTLEDNRFLVTAPIVNYNSRLGTLALVYEPNQYDLQYQRE